MRVRFLQAAQRIVGLPRIIAKRFVRGADPPDGPMNKVIWVLVNCNSIKEAQQIGKAILKRRFVSCFDIIPRHSASYYWPPKSGKIETTKGATLILETFGEKYNLIKKEIKKLHGDKLPFIGFVEIKGIDKEYINWIKGELKNE